MRYPLIIRILQDVLADKTRRKISQQEVVACCNDLARNILVSYKPDIVVAIDTGGSIPGEMVAKALDVPVVHFLVRRDITIARRYSLDPIPWRWTMSMYHHFLFQTVKPVILAQIDTDISRKKVLIVDDALYTGATVDVVIQYLRAAGAAEIKISSLAYVADRKPDFSILPKGNYSFPWSKDFENLGN